MPCPDGLTVLYHSRGSKRFVESTQGSEISHAKHAGAECTSGSRNQREGVSLGSADGRYLREVPEQKCNPVRKIGLELSCKQPFLL
jgi:hypothetical protein